VFAPQKGATPEQCRQLEANLSHLRQLLKNLTGQDVADCPGAGAAGGLGYGLRHLPRSGIVSGSQWVAEQLGLPDKIRQADLIITGEGRLDATSLGGKATGHLLTCAQDKPVMVVCGQVEAGLKGLKPVTVFPLVQAGESPEMAMAHPKAALQTVLVNQLLPAVQAIYNRAR
jgi:glycerate kinase